MFAVITRLGFQLRLPCHRQPRDYLELEPSSNAKSQTHSCLFLATFNYKEVMPATATTAHRAHTPSPTPERRRRLEVKAEVKATQASAWSRAVVAEEVRARAAARLAAAEQEREGAS